MKSSAQTEPLEDDNVADDSDPLESLLDAAFEAAFEAAPAPGGPITAEEGKHNIFAEGQVSLAQAARDLFVKAMEHELNFFRGAFEVRARGALFVNILLPSRVIETLSCSLGLFFCLLF